MEFWDCSRPPICREHFEEMPSGICRQCEPELSAARCPACKSEFVVALPANCEDCLAEKVETIALRPIQSRKR